MSVYCPYCGHKAELKTGSDLYPRRRDLGHVKAWVCEPCDARVGCHDGTDKPKGTMANQSLRDWRMKAHAAFDPFWKGKGKNLSRRKAYHKLAGSLNIDPRICHIGMFDAQQCIRVLDICRVWREENAT